MPDVQVFAKRFWGFNPAVWPVVSFSKAGNRYRLLRASRPGDLVLFIGTKTEDTDPDDQGRLLGLAEFGRDEIEAAEVVDLQALLRRNIFDENGQLRWPKALPMIRAWRIVNRPFVTEVLHDQLPYSATVQALRLDDTDTAKVLALQHEEVAVPDHPVLTRLRALHDALRPGGPTTGPRPTSWSGTVHRDATEKSCTYAFRFGKRDLWKIGHAKDVTARLAEIDRHVPDEVLGERWQPGFQHPWDTEVQAYDMEQRVLARLRTPSSVFERVCCSERQLQTIWSDSLVAPVPRRQSAG
jgi:hypothetical protein